MPTDAQIATNTALLEELFLHREPVMPYFYTHPYEPRDRQLLDVAIATVARHTPETHVYEIAEAEELDDIELLELIRVIAGLWQNTAYLTDAARNLLIEPPAGAGWEAGLRHHLAVMLATRGVPLRDDTRSSGWEDPVYMEIERELRPSVQAVLTVWRETWDDPWEEGDGVNYIVEGAGHGGISGIVLMSDRTVRKLRFEMDVNIEIRKAADYAPTRYYGGTGWL